MAISKEELVPNVKRAIEEIISSEKIISPPMIEISPGCEVGDGFASKTLAVDIKGLDKTINLFVKYFPEDDQNPLIKVFAMVFNTEFRFYDKIFPEMIKFQQEKGLTEQEMFQNVPKHLKTLIEYNGIPPIILENLRPIGYKLRNFKSSIDEDHLTLSLKAYAQYHAISFAMKDQRSELFKKLSVDIKDFHVAAFNVMRLADSLGGMIDSFLSNLDPVLDRKLLNECRNLKEVLIHNVANLNKLVDDYAVICQGDCWSNNMMYLYDETTGKPIDVKLVDWQIQRYNSPVLDVSYFFYSVATIETLKNFDKYFNFYYNTLAEFLKRLGSDPRKLYPKVVYLNHWKKFSKFGLTMCFVAFMVEYAKKDNLPDFIDGKGQEMPEFAVELDEKDMYQKRLKLLVEHFVERDFL
nr:uncharacterized protein LOC111429218 [Onthophagus taurus]